MSLLCESHMKLNKKNLLVKKLTNKYTTGNYVLKLYFFCSCKLQYHRSCFSLKA